MCLVLIAKGIHPRFPMVLAANRDEYYQRPAEQAHFWQDNPGILSGRDLEKGGTWLAVDRRGRIAAVTNFREPSRKKRGHRSRGYLVSEYVMGDLVPSDYLDRLSGQVDEYDSFNLFVGDRNTLCFISTFNRELQQLRSGIYGISNGDLDYPWPKVVKGKQVMQQILESDRLDTGRLFELLQDRETPPDGDLPETGVGLDIERMLSPIFVNGKEYGTRCSTVITLDNENNLYFAEVTYDVQGRHNAPVEYEFRLK